MPQVVRNGMQRLAGPKRLRGRLVEMLQGRSLRETKVYRTVLDRASRGRSCNLLHTHTRTHAQG